MPGRGLPAKEIWSCLAEIRVLALRKLHGKDQTPGSFLPTATVILLAPESCNTFLEHSSRILTAKSEAIENSLIRAQICNLAFNLLSMTSKVPVMNSSNFRVRRATLDDVSRLAALWNSMKFPADALSKRVTEFQIAESAESELVGAVGLEIAQKQGRIHSEAFTDFSLADQLRPMLWERLHAVATNHGLLRLWTQEKAPFWSHCGLSKADPEALQKLPAAWKTECPDWLTLKLKEDLETLVSLDKEFAMFMDSEKERTARAFQHAKILKIVATLIALGLFIVVLAAAFFVLRRGGIPQR